MFPRFMSRIGDANLGLCTRVHAFLEKDSCCPVLLEVALTPLCHVPVKSQSSTLRPRLEQANTAKQQLCVNNNKWELL